jgi:ATP-binding cassette subfamily C protein LapB
VTFSDFMGRFTPQRNKGPSQHFDPKWSMSLGECLLMIAEKPGDIKIASSAVPNIHALKALAATMDRGLDIRNFLASDIESHVLPLIAVLTNGRGVIILEKSSDAITLMTNDGIKIVSVDVLDVHARKAVFLTGFNDSNELKEKNNLNNNSDIAFGGNLHSFLKLIKIVLSNNPSSHYLLIIAAVISNTLVIALPLFIMNVYDRVIPHGAIETLWALALGVVIALAIDTAVRYARAKLSDAVAIEVTFKLHKALFRAFIQSRVEKTPTGVAELANSFRDIESATALVPSLIVGCFVDVPFVIFILILVQSLSGPVVWAPVAGILFFAIWAWTNTVHFRHHGAKDAKIHSERSNLLAESTWLSRAIKAANAEEGRISRFEAISFALVPTGHILRLSTMMQPQITMIVVQLVIVFCVIIGVYQIIQGSMSVGALAATTLLVGRVLTPVGQLLMQASRASQLSRPLAHAFSLLDLPRELPGDVSANRLVNTGKIELINLSFTFQGSHRPSLEAINLKIRPGEKIGLIGRSGSGKSTLLQLLVRFLDGSSGQFLIDDFDARQYAPQAIRSAFAYMPQEADIFDGTVSENIMIGNPAASQDELEKALSASGARDFLRNLPEGLSCKTGVRGARLSGGERQSIALARALIAPSKLLILDEPTSSMDNTTEARVIEALKGSCKERTLILSTHRMQALGLVERVIWLEQGRIVADGPRAEVLGRLQVQSEQASSTHKPQKTSAVDLHASGESRLSVGGVT